MNLKSAALKEPAPSARPRTKPAQVRLDELMNAAQTLFLEQGFETTTINDIVTRADVGKGTFYHYFASKNEILDALAKRYTEAFLERLEQAVDACATEDWGQKLRAWIGTSVIAYVETYRVHDVVYIKHHHHDRSNQAKNAILDQLLDILEGGVKAGLWAPQNLRVVALLIYAGVHGATDDIIADPSSDKLSFAQAVADSCLRLLPSPERSMPEPTLRC